MPLAARLGSQVGRTGSIRRAITELDVSSVTQFSGGPISGPNPRLRCELEAPGGAPRWAPRLLHRAKASKFSGTRLKEDTDERQEIDESVAL
jgi:hypothetical protein